MTTNGAIHDRVREYYGRVLQSSQDLKTSACCSTETMPAAVRAALREVHPEIIERFYGCGSPIPPGIEGLTVLDLGCGTGRDTFVLSKLVGSQGKVIGIDMTEEQIALARRHIAYHTERFGFAHPNVELRHGYIEQLAACGIGDETIDLVVSNCVINLSPDKEAVFREIFRVLKPGGELYFADIFADRRIPPGLRDEPLLRGECLGGALYTEDFRRLLSRLGVADCRAVSARPITIDDEVVYEKIGMVKFRSLTLRAFKLPLEDRCEDFGQSAIYHGTLPGHPHEFALDDHHLFETGRPMLVCGNTADMLSRTRFGQHFTVLGTKEIHFGLFPCATMPQTSTAVASGACC